MGIIGLLDGDEILRRTAMLLTDEYGFHLGWIAEPSAEGARIRYVSGNRTDHFTGVVLRRGLGLGGKVLASGQPHWVDDYLASAEITHEYDDLIAAEQLRRVVAAPMIAGGQNFGVLLGGHRDGGPRDERDAAIVEAVAERCARALSIAERARAAAEAAVFDDRRRTALELHDTIGTLLLGIASSTRAIGENPAVDAELKERLRAIERQASEATSKLGTSVFALMGSPYRFAPVPDTEGASRHARRPIAKREYDVLRHVATGETNHEIAAAMSLTCNTVKTYLRNAMSKLGARNRVEAIVRAREMGLL